jgi:hypothetical protein
MTAMIREVYEAENRFNLAVSVAVLFKLLV